MGCPQGHQKSTARARKLLIATLAWKMAPELDNKGRHQDGLGAFRSFGVGRLGDVAVQKRRGKTELGA